MTPDELRKIIAELKWSRAFAADYAMRSTRTLRKWLSGESPVSIEPARGFRDRERCLAYETFCRLAEGSHE